MLIVDMCLMILMNDIMQLEEKWQNPKQDASTLVFRCIGTNMLGNDGNMATSYEGCMGDAAWIAKSV